MRQWLPFNPDAQLRAVGEITQAKPTRRMFLREIDLAFLAMQRATAEDAAAACVAVLTESPPDSAVATLPGSLVR